MQPNIDVRAMHCAMATSRPASPPPRQAAMIELAEDEDVARIRLHLGVATQTKIIVRLEEQLAVNRSVRTMADRATLAHGFVLENKCARLFPMTFCAGLIQSRHRQSSGWFHDIASMWIMALHAAHPAFHEGMVLRQVELCMHLQMAIETNCRLLAGIHDELSPAGRLHMFTRGSMARFTAGKPRPLKIVLVKARVGAAGKKASDISVAIHAGFVANEGGAFDVRRRHHRTIRRRARAEQQQGCCYDNKASAAKPDSFPHIERTNPRGALRASASGV